MKKHLFHTLLAALAVPGLHAAPVQLAGQSFEGTGLGFTTSVPQFDETTVATSDFFSVQPNNGTKLSAGTLAGGDGANMFAAEDIDTVPGPGVGATQSITFNAVNIAGKTSTSVKLLLSAPGTGASQSYYDWSATAADIDLLRVEASVDGGPFNRLAQFAPAVQNLNQVLSLDTDGDGAGGQGTALTGAFQNFDFPFPTGNSVQIRVVMHSNATSEYLCLDNVRIFGDTPATAAPVLAGVPATALAYTEGAPATAVAPAITVTDADSANLTSATVTISQNLVSSEDVLAATPSGAILAGDIVFTPATGTLTITRSATKATYQTVLRSVTYRNSNTSAPSILPRHIRFSATDGTGTSNQPIREVTVNDAITLQTLPFVESFETDGRGSRYALDGRFTSSAVAYFDRQTTVPGVTNLDGTAAVVAEDTDINAAPEKAVRFMLNTTGFISSQAVVRLGAPGGSIYDTGDLIAVETSADGGAWTAVANFRSTASGAGSMALDTNNDGTGDGTPLTAALQNFTFNLPAATALGLRVRFVSNVGGERLVVDRIAVTGILPPVIVSNTSDSAPGSLRAAIATALAQPGATTITFDPSLNGQTIPLLTSLSITDATGVIIDASGLPAGVSISGNNLVRIFTVAAGAVVTLRDVTLTGGNSGSAPGGAINSAGNLSLKGCTLVGNTTTGGGGAIGSFNATANLLMENCTMTGNTASYGGAIWSNAAPFSLLHCTISNNTGNGGTAGIVIEGNSGSITNCIIAGNVTSNGDRDIGGGGTTLTRSGVNLIGVPAGSYSAQTAPGQPNANGDFIGTLSAPLNPRLAPLASNGGRTRTMHPLLGSPARDRIATTSVTTDQRGVARGQWGASDVGAVEAGIQADCAWEVRDVFTSPVTALGNLANTDAMLANPAATQITGTVPVVNFSDLNGVPNNGFFPTGDSLFLCDNLTPQGLANQDDDSFATQARAFITITAAGDYTFGFSSDDGARLRLYSTTGTANPVFTSSTQLTGGNPNNLAHNGNALTFNAPTGNSATLGVVNLIPGVYGVEFTMWEDFGGSSAEVIFATGAQTAFGGAFSLLGGNMLTRTPGASRPVNDDFAATLPLSGAVVHTSSCNAGATMEAGEPAAIPSSSGVRAKSVWWTWTAPANGGYQVDTIGSSFDTVLAVLTGSSIGGLAEVAINDDSGGLTSTVTFGAVAGTVYRIQVSGYNGAEGNILLNIGPPANFPPSFTTGPNQSVFTNAGPQTVLGWATAISPGAPWETAQSVSFTVSTTNPGLFVGTPAVLSDGTLTYVPAPTNGGTATVTVQAVDNATPPLTSAPQSFTITTSLSPTTGTTLTINAGGTGSGTATLAQNFNTLSAASVAWVDNSTVPGWYAQINDAVTPSGTFQPSNGSAALNGLINCGSTGAPADRSLGSKATGTGNVANISYAVVMRNVGSLPVKLSRIRYAEELWRSGSIASPTQVEKVTTFYAISNTPLASIASGPSSGAAVAGAGFAPLPIAANTQIGSTTTGTALDGNVAANRSAVDYTLLAGDAFPAIFPGQYITIKWTDTNETAGTDGHQAIDDVTLDFTEVPCAIFAIVSNVVRNLNSLNGSTDTVDFTLNVAGVGNGLSSGYTITAPAAFTGSGTYGTPLSFTGRPLSDFTPTPVLSIRDATDVNCTTTATVTLPLVLGRNLLSNSYIQAQSPPAILRQTAAGFFPEVTMDPGTAVLTTDAAALTPGTEKCFNLHVDVIDSSTSSGFEADDTLKVELLSTTPAGLEIETMTYDADLNANGVMNGGATPLADEFNLQQKANAIKWTSTFHLVGTIPATATSVRLRISAAILGQTTQPYTEVFRFKLAELLSCPDSDADGISDAWEISDGTLGNDPASYFGLSSVTSDATNLNLAVRTDNQVSRTYQLLTSPDLQTWTRDGLPSAVSGLPSGPWPPLPFSRPITGPRRFYKVLVQQPQIENP